MWRVQYVSCTDSRHFYLGFCVWSALRLSHFLSRFLRPCFPSPASPPSRAAVLLSYTNASDGSVVSVPVNACLRPLLSCAGMSVTTIEGVGSLRAGYHPVQTRLAQNAGSQCGFCSPGFAVNAFSLLVATPAGQKPTAQQVEDQFQGNLCRCTGYRPILEAFRSFCGGGGADGETAAGAWLGVSFGRAAGGTMHIVSHSYQILLFVFVARISLHVGLQHVPRAVLGAFPRGRLIVVLVLDRCVPQICDRRCRRRHGGLVAAVCAAPVGPTGVGRAPVARTRGAQTRQQWTRVRVRVRIHVDAACCMRHQRPHV